MNISVYFASLVLVDGLYRRFSRILVKCVSVESTEQSFIKPTQIIFDALPVRGGAVGIMSFVPVCLRQEIGVGGTALI